MTLQNNMVHQPIRHSRVQGAQFFTRRVDSLGVDQIADLIDVPGGNAHELELGVV